MIEGRHASFEALMEDPESTTADLVSFGGNADDAVLRCNEDKKAAKRVLNGETK